MQEVTVNESLADLGRTFLVKYELITGEEKTIKVPYELAAEERFGDILRLITKDLGQFPGDED